MAALQCPLPLDRWSRFSPSSVWIRRTWKRSWRGCSLRWTEDCVWRHTRRPALKCSPPMSALPQKDQVYTLALSTICSTINGHSRFCTKRPVARELLSVIRALPRLGQHEPDIRYWNGKAVNTLKCLRSRQRWETSLPWTWGAPTSGSCWWRWERTRRGAGSWRPKTRCILSLRMPWPELLKWWVKTPSLILL